MFDEEILISHVRDYEELYDVSAKHYYNTSRKAECWRQISRKMNEPVDMCKSTWKRLREQFRKAMTARSSTRGGESRSKRKPWKYENQMNFLLPYLGDKKAAAGGANQSSRQSDDEDTAKEEEISMPEAEVTLESTEDAQQRTPSPSGTSEKYLASTGRPHDQESAESMESVQPASGKRSRRDRGPFSESSDPVGKFFSSMADTVKSLPPKVQVEVKRQVFEAVTQAELEHVNGKYRYLTIRVHPHPA